MARRPLIAANWKMNKTIGEARAFCEALLPEVEGRGGGAAEVVICPPYLALPLVAQLCEGTGVGVAAQNMYYEESGAYTGEVSAAMLLDAGAGAVILGHSERRTLFGETDAIVNRKVLAAFSLGLEPIVCIGETLDQRERGETFDVLDRQIKSGLDGLTGEQLALLVMAYEPVWAIGTGRNATPAQAAEAHGHIRQRLRQ